MKKNITLWTFLILFDLCTISAWGQFNFSSSTLIDGIVVNPTSLQFGPDNKLYVSQQDGTIKIFTIEKTTPNSYKATTTEELLLVKRIPNHFDDGTARPYNMWANKRQITGFYVGGTANNPILYVSSSDNEIGGGGESDKNLCTNSGVISKLVKVNGEWTKVDLVRGLPRSEENHATNGLIIDESTNMLYACSAGFTNAGSPSKLFSYIGEYALSACILQIDLNVIEALPLKTDPTGANPYKYDLPTLDDPSRTNNSDGTDINDPWGGNDGLNQAKIIPGGPVKVYATGLRNPYDVLLTKSPGNEGKIYTIDNGPNVNWGGHPNLEGTAGVTNNYVPGEPGSVNAGPNDPMVNNLDGFHYIGNTSNYVIGSYYGGHPNPVRANPAGAGLYIHEGTIDAGVGVWRTSKTDPTNPLPSDWPPVPVSMAHPIEGDFQNPGETNKALVTFRASTNGICEYTASTFNGALKGNIFAASLDGNIHRLQLGTGGSSVLNSLAAQKVIADPPFASGFAEKPLDITCQGDQQIFPGSIWVAAYSTSSIIVFEPSVITCTGAISNQDEDGDKYTNADEIDNGTDPCSAASKPSDHDLDFISDKKDTDDDNDGIPDLTDFFQIDPQNGLTKEIPFTHNLFNNDPGTGFFGLGFTGLMINNQSDYLTLYDENYLIAGGAVGAFTIVDVPTGTCDNGTNSQKYGFQFGVKTAGTNVFTVKSAIIPNYFNGTTPQDKQSQGIFIGTGDQDNYLKVALNSNGGAGGIEVVIENNGVATKSQYTFPGGIPNTETIRFYITVNATTNSAQVFYSTPAIHSTSLGTFTLPPSIMEVIKNPGKALAIGITASSVGATPFSATWDYIEAYPGSITSIIQWHDGSTSEKIHIHPNPSDDNIFIDVESAKNISFKVKLFNNLGQFVNESEMNWIPGSAANSIDVANLTKGIYYLQFVSDDKLHSATVKFIKE